MRQAMLEMRLIGPSRWWRQQISVLNVLIAVVLTYGAATIATTSYFIKELNRITISSSLR